MEFRILGSFEVVAPAGPVNLRGAKRRGLLACLVAHAGHPMSADQLVEEVWGEAGGEGAARTVRTYVWQLRKLLRSQGASLRTRPDGYLLEVDPADVDAYRFEQALKAAGAEPDPAHRLAVLDGGLELWRGPPLGEFAGAGWADREAGRLEALHLQALQSRYDALLELDRAGDAAAELEFSVRTHPFDERFAAQFMLALYRCGRQADALGAYQQTRRCLVGELGIEPGRDLMELERRILDHDPTLAAPTNRLIVARDAGVVDSGTTGGRSLPTGTVTFLFTDQEQSSSLWESDPAAMDLAVTHHDAVLRSTVARWRGWGFSTAGDGFGAAFASPGDAIQAALEARSTLRAQPWPNGLELRVRMGLHTGATLERDGDYFGPSVTRAVRIMGAAHGGQVLVSRVTRELIDEQRLGLRFVDLGRYCLRGLDVPEHLYQLLIEGDDTTYPPPVTLGAAGCDLPVPRSSLHGREEDAAALMALLTTTRVVTLVGVGGVGKTRLAVEVARRIAGRFESVTLVDLAAVSDHGGVLGAMAAAFRIPGGAKSSTVTAIVRSLRARDALVVFDNCEHVLEATSGLIEDVSAATTGCSFLATSRAPLGVEGEQLWPVLPLDPADARELFLSRARALRPKYELGPGDRQVLDGLCRHLDGLPLALELAAAQTGYLSVSELLEGLDQRFQLLSSGRRRTHHRSRSLEATMEWSYQLLGSDEQRLLRACSVFPGGFTVETLAGVTRIDPSAVRVVVGSLVTKSLVAIDDWQAHPTRYRLLETVREYARGRLVDADEAEALGDQFYIWFCDKLVDEVAPVGDRATGGHKFSITEMDNLLAALDRANDRGDLVRVGRTVPLLIIGLPTYQWIDVARKFVRRADIESALFGDELALYLVGGAWTENAGGRYRDQLMLAERALAEATPGDRAYCAAAFLVINALAVLDPQRGLSLSSQVLSQVDGSSIAVRRGLLSAKADCAVMSGGYDEALELYGEAYGPRLRNWPADLARLLVVIGREEHAKELVRDELSEDDFYRYNLELGRAVIAASDGSHDVAFEHLRAAARLARRHAAYLLDRDLLVVAAALALLRGDSRRASVLLAVERDTFMLRSPPSWVLYLHVRDRVRQILGRDQIADCKAEARTFTVDRALADELGEAWPLEP